MKIFSALKKVLTYPSSKILEISLNDFCREINQYDFSYEELVIVLGIILNKAVLEETKTKLKLIANNYQEEVIITFAVFTYIFIGDEYNDIWSIKKIKINLVKNHKHLFIATLKILIKESSRFFNLSRTLGDDNDRANMFAVNALLNIKRGLGIDNFHLTLFTVYQSLELKLKHCLKKYIDNEPSAQKKQINFHNLVRLVKLISTTRITDSKFADILKNLREYLRYFEKINPGGQAARYEAGPNSSYFNQNSYSFINEKELLENFVQALSLLEQLYLKLIEIYDSKEAKIQEKIKSELVDNKLADLIGANLNDGAHRINNKLANLMNHQIFGNAEELVNLSYKELTILRLLIRIGFLQSINQAVQEFLKN